ncbi:hypothetical protein OH779_05905 [Actinacidiphila glaucinigra]|uniref:hypothetical protein n=1 Tax=Actinacidiphila glaucinigra TaxID=235986 RepID=UPI00386994BE
MDESTRLHRRGDKVPVSGIYTCTCDEEHRFTGTGVLGHTFPPVPKGCSGVGWHLSAPAHAECSP